MVVYQTMQALVFDLIPFVHYNKSEKISLSVLLIDISDIVKDCSRDIVMYHAFAIAILALK